MQLGLIRWTLEVLRCPFQLAQKEGLECRVVEEEGKGGHAMLGGASLFTAGPLAEHSRAQRTWKILINVALGVFFRPDIQLVN